MKTHTPGPWHVGMKPGPILYGPKGEQVADLTARLLPDDEATGNARLIAAAPEMKLALIHLLREHDALQMAEGSHEDRWSAATIARSILNKIDA